MQEQQTKKFLLVTVRKLTTAAKGLVIARLNHLR